MYIYCGPCLHWNSIIPAPEYSRTDPSNDSVNKSAPGAVKPFPKREKLYQPQAGNRNSEGYQPLGALPLEAQPLEAQPLEAQPLEAQPLGARPLEAQPLGAQPLEGQGGMFQPNSEGYQPLGAGGNFRLNTTVHCENESVYSTPLCPNTHTVYGFVCIGTI